MLNGTRKCANLQIDFTIVPFQPSVAFHTETIHLICIVNQMNGFYMKGNMGYWNHVLWFYQHLWQKWQGVSKKIGGMLIKVSVTFLEMCCLVIQQSNSRFSEKQAFLDNSSSPEKLTSKVICLNCLKNFVRKSREATSWGHKKMQDTVSAHFRKTRDVCCMNEKEHILII